MKVIMVAVKDEAGNAFIDVQVAPTTAVAIRNFASICKSKGAFGETVRNNPKDFNLYLLAEYDNETGAIFPKGQPVVLSRAEEFSIKEDKVNG